MRGDGSLMRFELCGGRCGVRCGGAVDQWIVQVPLTLYGYISYSYLCCTVRKLVEQVVNEKSRKCCVLYSLLY